MASKLGHSSVKRQFRAAYDAQLREGAELAAAESVDRLGPLWLAKFGSRGFVTYRSLGSVRGKALDNLIAQTVTFFDKDETISRFEWKTRGHDAPEDLTQRLVTHGFQADEPETVMVGEAKLLAVDVALPAEVTLRRIGHAPDAHEQLIKAAETQTKAFGTPYSVGDLERRISKNPGNIEIWVADTAEGMVTVGRLEIVAGTEFAGLWGGGTLPEWRGRGIYRALTSARAKSALARGIRYLHSDCTEFSRPILERSGLIAITTTRPFIWIGLTHAGP